MLIDTNHSPRSRTAARSPSQFENDERVFRTTKEHTNAFCVNPREAAHTHGVQTTLSDRSGREHAHGSRVSARDAGRRASNPVVNAGLREPLMPHGVRGVAAAAQAHRYVPATCVSPVRWGARCRSSFPVPAAPTGPFARR